LCIFAKKIKRRMNIELTSSIILPASGSSPKGFVCAFPEGFFAGAGFYI